MAGTVPANRFLLAGTDPVNMFSFDRTVPANKFFFDGTLKKFQKMSPPLKVHLSGITSARG